MNKAWAVVSLMVALVLAHEGLILKSASDRLRQENALLDGKNAGLAKDIQDKGRLAHRAGLRLAAAYALVMNQVRVLEDGNAAAMSVHLETAQESRDIADHFEPTAYQGVKGLKIKIIIDKFSRETDMGAVLDDIYVLEKNTDFLASDIAKDNNNLIVKGEIYGL